MTEELWQEHRRRRRRALFAVAGVTSVVTALVMYVLFYIKLPYEIFGPGAAVDLNSVISIAHRSPPPGSIFLTDVTVLPGRPAYYAAAKVLPGFEIVKREEVVPPTMSDAQLDVALVDEMKQSQEIAAVVAERAAGLSVPSHPSVIVQRVVPKSPAAHCFRVNDRIVAVDGTPIATVASVTDATKAKPSGAAFRFRVIRGRSTMTLTCKTATIQGRPRFGISIGFDAGEFRFPVPVKFDVHNINGSSAGLMFALQIYRTLTGRGLGPAKMIAGTGVLELNGTVDPIEGTREKLMAAKRAGATVFLVPRQNFADIKDTQGITIVQVGSFAEALRALSNFQQ